MHHTPDGKVPPGNTRQDFRDFRGFPAGLGLICRGPGGLEVWMTLVRPILAILGALALVLLLAAPALPPR
jgi:hypothetical protein